MMERRLFVDDVIQWYVLVPYCTIANNLLYSNELKFHVLRGFFANAALVIDNRYLKFNDTTIFL
jgi:hypothetical protein